ncbi:DUF4136 domain-containing protein [Alcaligenaceae bacterium CGII-47]|nr:DUF4136 domain-containing protein [Alcaligenaceae bacterium CGII-47]
MSVWSRWSSTMRFGGVVLALSLLSGCASSLSAQVTRYQQWPANTAGEHYRLIASDTQRNNLPFLAYADMVRAAIGATGLVEAQSTSPARFELSLDYGNPVEQRWVQRQVDPYYDGAFGFYRPPFGGRFSSWGGWMMVPQVQDVPVNLYKNTLTVMIRDRDDHNKEVYRATAVSLGQSDNLTAIMPYLARAVFDQFPGRNGQVIEVQYDLPR